MVLFHGAKRTESVVFKLKKCEGVRHSSCRSTVFQNKVFSGEKTIVYRRKNEIEMYRKRDVYVGFTDRKKDIPVVGYNLIPVWVQH